MKNYQIQTDEYMAKSATFLNVCKSGSQTLYSLGGFKDSKQFNIKGTQRLVYTHNVNLMTPSTELCKHRSTQIL